MGLYHKVFIPEHLQLKDTQEVCTNILPGDKIEHLLP
jgi:hypothetical protein